VRVWRCRRWRFQRDVSVVGRWPCLASRRGTCALPGVLNPSVPLCPSGGAPVTAVMVVRSGGCRCRALVAIPGTRATGGRFVCCLEAGAGLSLLTGTAVPGAPRAADGDGCSMQLPFTVGSTETPGISRAFLSFTRPRSLRAARRRSANPGTRPSAGVRQRSFAWPWRPDKSDGIVAVSDKCFKLLKKRVPARGGAGPARREPLSGPGSRRCRSRKFGFRPGGRCECTSMAAVAA